ncbi:hypothetical protein FRC08_009415 [Ceratobasidium sp. 394]|nr:hypothetical protein FRC08_009415 [Ceratobasidium sp. 394]
MLYQYSKISFNSTTTKSFHRALAIPEILDGICGFIDNGTSDGVKHPYGYLKRTRRADLASLLQTCRALFHPAARYLWGSIISIRHLLLLLPDTRIAGKNNLLDAREWVYDNIILVWNLTSGPLPINYFDRFKIYATYVKYLFVRNTFWLNILTTPRTVHPLADTNDFRSSLRRQMLLPNLTTVFLHYCNPSCANIITAIPNCLEWLKLFLVSSLTRFDLHGDSSFRNASTTAKIFELVRTAIQECPRLEHLAFPLHTVDGNHSAAVTSTLESIPVSQKLSFFECYYATLSPALLRFIQRMPYLNELRLPSLWVPSDSAQLLGFPDNAFTALKRLKMYDPSTEATIALWHTPVVRHLTHINIGMCTETYEWKWPLEKTTEWFGLVNRNTPGLMHLELSSPRESLLVDHFHILHALPIRSLNLANSSIRDFKRPNAIYELIQIWSTLRQVRLGEPTLTIEVLTDILLSFPNLEFLSFYQLFLRGSPVSPIQREFSRGCIYRPLTLVIGIRTLGCRAEPKCDEIRELARYLWRIRPNIRCEPFKDSSSSPKWIKIFNDATAACSATGVVKPT